MTRPGAPDSPSPPALSKPATPAKPAATGPLALTVGEDEAGRRLDVLLADEAQVPRSQVQRWIEAGRVRLNDRPARSSRRVALGDVVLADPPEPVAPKILAEAIPLRVVYEDADVIVIDKSPDMVVHPAPGHSGGTLVNALLHHCGDLAGVGGVLRPGIVHRLDRGTSGILVAAKNDAAHVALSRQFHDHSIDRVYEAFVRSLPGVDRGRIERRIGRHARDRKRMAVRDDGGREAVTNWRVERRFRASGVTHLELRPETGRTHQLRVHLASVGMPIVADPVYGRGSGRPRVRIAALPDRPALHARRLGFRHPRTGESVVFEAPLPADLMALWRALDAREPEDAS